MAEQQSQKNGFVIAGYLTAVLPILTVPILFMPAALIIGVACLSDNKAIHGWLIITIALSLGLLGAHIGGWGLGLPKLGDDY